METILKTLRSLKQKVTLEMDVNLIPFWLKHVKAGPQMGFTDKMTNSLQREASAKGLVLHTRLLWTFSSLFQFKQDLVYLRLAQECYEYIYTYFMDSVYGGAYWTLSGDGNPQDVQKKTYGQVFLIYALSEFYKCCQISAIRAQCEELFYKLEKHALDSAHLGYFEVCTRDWKLAEHQRLSEKDMDEKKSMNTHLHILEAFTNLHKIWPNDLLRHRLIMLLELFREKIIHSDSGHFSLFFDERWNRRSQGISFGHEIEACWLIREAAEILNDGDLRTVYEGLSEQLAAGVYADGMDAEGGLYYEIDETGSLDTDKHFWTQAEAVVGFLNAYELTGRDKYLNTAVSIWDFIQVYLVDRQYGEWFWKVDANGTPDNTLPKICNWKGPYHNIRACLEIIKRIDSMVIRHTQKGAHAYGRLQL